MRTSVLLFLLSFSLCSNAQVLPDEITIKEKRFGYELYQGPISIGHNRVKHLLKDCPQGLNYYRSGKSMEGLGTLCAAIGVVAASAALGNYYLNGKTANPVPLLIPAGALIAVGIPLYASGGKRVKLGTALYNEHCLPPIP